MSITSRERLTGRFNAHYERMLFGLAEEVFWAGDKEAEGAIKALATAEELDYERKGIDTEAARNYTRLMICSNVDWVVPAGSGGRRWFVLRVGNEHEQDHAYFAAIDAEMESGGLAAMLHDLQHTPLASTVNVRKAPVTPWLIEQRVHIFAGCTQDVVAVCARRRWLPDRRRVRSPRQVGLSSLVRRDDVLASARPFFDKKNRPATMESVRAFIAKELEGHSTLFYEGQRQSTGKRKRTYVLAGYDRLREVWFQKYGERIEDSDDNIIPLHTEAECESDTEAFGAGWGVGRTAARR